MFTQDKRTGYKANIKGRSHTNNQAPILQHEENFSALKPFVTIPFVRKIVFIEL